MSLPFSTRTGGAMSTVLLALLAAAVAVAGVVVGVLVSPLAGQRGPVEPGPGAAASPELPSADPEGFRFTRLTDPPRTLVTDGQDVTVATFTDGARTVVVAGPVRTFAEPRFTSAVVQTSAWVRLSPVPWSEAEHEAAWVRPWLAGALADPDPDLLAVATQYLHDSPVVVAEDGMQIAGNASFGPEVSETRRAIGSDFHDYLGVVWQFDDGVEREPSADQFRSLDCSGYVRLVFGYRLGYPLLGGRGPGDGLPRRAHDMATTGPGALLIPDRGTRPADLDRLQAGDVLFFTTDDEDDIDHSAIYLGRDSDGLHRFVSSRATPDGPTLGDLGGPSVLDGDGFFAERFRTARRL